MLRAVRGAITVEENQSSLIQTAVARLVEEVLTENRIQPTAIVCVFFTVTPDLTALNPAKAVRQSRNDWAAVQMMCADEPVMDGMLPRCIRIMIQYDAPEGSPLPRPVYLEKARELRPDLTG
jgi:chorismate mutase